MITCHYCRANNAADEPRCVRCGRRLMEAPDGRSAFPVQQSAAAPQLYYAPATAPEPIKRALGPIPVERRRSDAAMERELRQASLFGPQAVRRSTDDSPAPRPRHSATTKRASKPDSAEQGTINFDATADGAKTLPTSVQAAIGCNAPLATRDRRATAAVIDVSISLLGIATFFATLYFAGVGLDLGSRSTQLCLGGAAFLIAILYRVFFCLGNCDTPGVQLSGLRLLNFDGLRPTRHQRWRRLAGGMLSVLSAGIGLLWALVDEEKLSWHDHISETFPSPRTW